MTTKQRYAEKRLIHLTREQEERIAAQSAQKIQAFVNELNQVQARRCEVMTGLLIAHVTHHGVADIGPDAVEKCQKLAHALVDADARQKWSDLKGVFAELGIKGPQPHLEFAAKRVGVILFDELVDAELAPPAGEPVRFEGVIQ